MERLKRPKTAAMPTARRTVFRLALGADGQLVPTLAARACRRVCAGFSSMLSAVDFLAFLVHCSKHDRVCLATPSPTRFALRRAPPTRFGVSGETAPLHVTKEFNRDPRPRCQIRHVLAPSKGRADLASPALWTVSPELGRNSETASTKLQESELSAALASRRVRVLC